MPDAVLTVASGGKVAQIRLGRLRNGERFFYPLLTSEQILSGMKPADSRGARTDVGLLRTGTEAEGYQVMFVIGQRNWNDINEEQFVEFRPGGAFIGVEDLTEERMAHNILYAGPLGGDLERDLAAYPGDGARKTELTLKEGTLIRFNLDNNSFLNRAKMYYKFTLDGAPCGQPSPEDGFVYNTRIPLYFGAGGDYPNGIILPPAAEHRRMTIRMAAYGVDCPEPEGDIFEITITE